MTPEAFARALVDRLATILPPGFVVRAEGDVVAVDAPDGFGGGTALGGLIDPQDREPQDYADAAWNVLSMAQDVVSESITEPWPAAVGPGGDLAEPGTRVEGGAVLLYFGPEDRPAVTLPPVPLAG